MIIFDVNDPLIMESNYEDRYTQLLSSLPRTHPFLISLLLLIINYYALLFIIEIRY